MCWLVLTWTFRHPSLQKMATSFSRGIILERPKGALYPSVGHRPTNRMRFRKHVAFIGCCPNAKMDYHRCRNRFEEYPLECPKGALYPSVGHRPTNMMRFRKHAAFIGRCPMLLLCDPVGIKRNGIILSNPLSTT